MGFLFKAKVLKILGKNNMKSMPTSRPSLGVVRYLGFLWKFVRGVGEI